MSLQAILLPLFIQVGLVLSLVFWLAIERTKNLQRNEVERSAIALASDAWPTRTRQIGNCFRNQFEAPVLFYLAVLVALIVRKTDLIFVVLEWAFVITRVWHAVIHTTWNYVPLRGIAYASGVVVLIAMWFLLAARFFG